MQHSRFLGSAFRNRGPQEPEPESMERTLVKSGLLGKNPSQYLPAKPPQPTIQPSVVTNQPDIKRPKTTMRSQTRQTLASSPRRSKIVPLVEICQTKPKETSNVYFGRALPSKEPPSSANFLQLSEMLDRYLEKDQSNEYEVYKHILGELARMYYIECGAEGELLMRYSENMDRSKEEFGKIEKSYKNTLNSIINSIERVTQEADGIKPEIETQIKKKDHLDSLIQDMRTDLSHLEKHYEQLVGSVAKIQYEVDDMRMMIAKLDARLSRKNHKLIALNEQVKILDSLVSQYTEDTIRFDENYKSLVIQHKISKSTKENLMSQIREAKEKIYDFDKQIAAQSEKLENSRIVRPKVEISLQTDLISRRVFQKISATKAQEVDDTYVSDSDVFNKFKRLFQASSSQQGDNIVVDSYENFSKLKRLILQNEDDFRLRQTLVEQGQNGEFSLHTSNNNLFRLFATRITQDAIYNAIRGKPHTDAFTQSLAPQPNNRNEQSAAEKLKDTSRFLGLISSDYSGRSPQRFDWFITNIRAIYDAKAQQNERTMADDGEYEAFPEFLYAYSRKQSDLEFLCDQFCWDIYLSAVEHKDKSQETEMFMDFLTEKYNPEQLAFFLIIRADCMKIGSPVSIRTRDQLDLYSEYFMAHDQIERSLPRWWQDRYERSIFLRIADFSVARPAIHLEATKRYVSMHSILYICVDHYAEDSVKRLDEILLQCRIVPRLTEHQFRKLMLHLIPVLTDQQIETFHRSTVTKSRQRSEVSLQEFVEMYHESSVLRRTRAAAPVSTKDSSGIHQSVVSSWLRYRNIMGRIFDYFQTQLALQPDNLTLKTYLDDASRHRSMLKHSISTGDGELSPVHFFQYLMSLDIMFSTCPDIRPPEFKKSIVSLEYAIREDWIDQQTI